MDDMFLKVKGGEGGQGSSVMDVFSRKLRLLW